MKTYKMDLFWRVSSEPQSPVTTSIARIKLIGELKICKTSQAELRIKLQTAAQMQFPDSNS